MPNEYCIHGVHSSDPCVNCAANLDDIRRGKFDDAPATDDDNDGYPTIPCEHCGCYFDYAGCGCGPE